MRAEPPRITEVLARSPAAAAGLTQGDLILEIDGVKPVDVIQYQLLVDSENPEFSIERDGVTRFVRLSKDEGEPPGIRLAASLFDRVKTCDNKCSFCFVYQLPDGMRESLYLKDDDYRLSFLYGNFTTLTRFRQADLDRVIEERISPLHVSIHTTNPELRASMLNNRKGATSLDWLAPMLEEGIEIHGQVVLCPGINDGVELERTLREVGEKWPRLASLGVVPLGVSRFSSDPALRPMTVDEMASALSQINRYQDLYIGVIGRRMVFASDEIYLGARVAFPPTAAYEGFMQHENGIGMAAALSEELDLTRSGAFSKIEGAPTGEYRRASRPLSNHRPAEESGSGQVVAVTGELGAEVIEPLLRRIDKDGGVELLVVANDFFGGNVGVTGLLTGRDVAAAIEISERAAGPSMYVVPDVVVPDGRFIDGVTIDELRTRTKAAVRVVPTDAGGLRMAVEWSSPSGGGLDRSDSLRTRSPAGVFR